jgi:hypothetical protein
MSADDEINVEIGSQNQGLLSGLKQAEDAITHSSGYIRASLSGITDVVERIKLPFIELAAVLAGGAAFRAFVEGTEQLGLELEKASQKTGIAVEDLAGLKFAAEEVDVSFDSVTKSMQKFSLVLQQANEGATTPGTKALTAMGISARDAAGNTKPLDELIGEVADKFKDYKDGADKTALAMNLFGRAGAEMIPFLNQGSAAIEGAKNEAKEMGAVMSGEAVDAAEKFHQAQDRVGLASQSLKISLGTALMPVLTLMANAFADSAKEGGVLHEVILVLRDAMELLSVALIGIVTSIRLIWDVGMFVFREIRDNVVGLGKVIWDVLHGRFAAAQADLKVTEAKMSQDFDTMVNSMVAHATAGGNAIAATLGKGAGPKKSAAIGNAPQVAGKDQTLEELKKQWALEKAGFALEVAQADDNFEQIVEIKRRELERVRQLFGEHSTEYLEMAADLQRELNSGEKDAAKIFEQIQKDGNEQSKALMEERKRQWETLMSGISNAVQSSVTGIVQGTTTMSNAIKNILKSLVAEYIAVGVKALIAHKATELAKTGATVEGTAQRVALEEWASVKSIAIGAFQAVARIGQYAVEGAAAAFKSIAAIPIIGPALAPAAAAAAGVLILGFAGHVASAEGGYDIPRGLNPITQLHQNEMVLPSALADKVRNMTDGAGSGNQLHVHVHTMDTKGVKQFLQANKAHLVSVLNGAERDFHFDGT